MNPHFDLEATFRALVKILQQLQLQFAQATENMTRHQNKLGVAAQKASELEAQCNVQPQE